MDNVVTASQMHTGLDAEATIELGTDLTGELKQDDPVWTGLQEARSVTGGGSRCDQSGRASGSTSGSARVGRGGLQRAIPACGQQPSNQGSRDQNTA